MTKITEAHSQEIDLFNDYRYEKLYKGWHRLKGEDIDPTDTRSVRVIARDEDKVVGIGRLFLASVDRGEIRDVIADKREVTGDILLYLEQIAQEQYLKSVHALVRESSVFPFESAGYTIIDEGPILFGMVPQYIMKKDLD